ncbi:acyltransferase [Microcystis aeruginosa]|uniref:acyltransferase n=1 Tax=Microcystis aeruginosa TaxID=1126 RepID=UPI001C8564BD|nr:acyltransferase [Microcystis aeruginosa]
MASLFRKQIYNTECFVDTNVFIVNKKNFRSGLGSALYHSCYILNNNGNFSMGNNSHLGAFCYVNVCYGNVSIGDHVAIGPGTKLIAYSNYYQQGKKVTEEKITKDVIINNNIFIGANCTILPGSIINSNVVIGAGSVVRGTLDANSIYAGVPCKKIKSGWYE